MADLRADNSQSQAQGVIPGEWHVRYNYSVGKVAGKYFAGLRARKISGDQVQYFGPHLSAAARLLRTLLRRVRRVGRGRSGRRHRSGNDRLGAVRESA